MAQLAVLVIFLFRSRKIEEISWLPEAMIIMATLSSAYYCVAYILIYFKMTSPALYYIAPAVKILVILNYGLLFRFVRLQVQLKAAEENSKKIMAQIQKSKRIEIFVYADLLIYSLTLLIYQIADYAIDNKETKTQIMNLSANIQAVTYLIFVSVFCYWLQQVNAQLAKFFDLVKEKSYLKKVIAFILLIFFGLGTNRSIQRLLLAAGV